MATDLSFSIEINGIQKTITSTAEASKVIKELTANFVQLNKAGKDVSATLTQIGQANKIKESLLAVSHGAVQIKQGMQGAQTASANASMALLNMNYVIRDSPYFFNNFALGVLAVGNNINPLIDSFNRLRMEAGEKSISTFALLKQALVGGAGISIAFSLVVTAIQSFVFWQASAKRKTEETAKAVSDLATALNQVVNVKMPSTISKYNISPEQLPFVIMSLDERIASMQGSKKAISNAPQTVGEGETRAKLDLQGLNKEVEKNIGNHQEILDELKKERSQLQAQFEIYKIMGDLGLKDEQLQKNRTKELKAQTRELGLSYNLMYGKKYGGFESKDTIANESARIEDEKKKLFQNRFGGFPTGMVGQPEDNVIKSINEEFEKTKENLKAAKQLSNIMGNAISNAFLSGKSAIDAATQALKQFIIELAVTQTMMGIFNAITGGAGGFLGGFLSFLPGGGAGMAAKVGNPNLGKSSSGLNVVVTGKLKANGNDFYANLEKVGNKYNSNIKVNKIGRG